MESSSSKLSARKRTFEFQDGRPLCNCGDLEVLWTSWPKRIPEEDSMDVEIVVHQKSNVAKRAEEAINGIKAENRILLKEKR
ncbi:hypothetical protein C2S51_029588 [Perilla frutescens var. frutescens]|nr:hypothetical protein C2S51_029588 [Perilla frutescens var. frutescens]